MTVRIPLVISASLVVAGCLGDRAADVPAPDGAIPARPASVAIRVQAAHNSDTFFLRVRFPQGARDARHETWRRVDGAWRLEGGGFRDLQAALDGDELRGDVTRVSAEREAELAILLDDPQSAGRLLSFREQGCFGQCHEFQRQMPNWRMEDGYRPMTVWTGAGKGDLWRWRAQRSALAGFADDLSFTSSGYVPDAGNAPFAPVALTSTANVPAYVFDPAGGGEFAYPWPADAAPLGFDDGSIDSLPDALSIDSAMQLGYAPADGDTVPAQLLATPTGSRADVTALSLNDGTEWDVVLTRKLSTGDAAGDLALASGRVYNVAFSLHRDAADGRDHYVSLATQLLVGTAGEGVMAVAVTGTGGGIVPAFSDETAFPVSEIALFLPGVTSFDWLVGSPVTREGEVREVDVVHGGGFQVSSAEWRCNDCHLVRASDPVPPVMNAGPLEKIVLRRGGVYTPTPFFEGDE